MLQLAYLANILKASHVLHSYFLLVIYFKSLVISYQAFNALNSWSKSPQNCGLNHPGMDGVKLFSHSYIGIAIYIYIYIYI